MNRSIMIIFITIALIIISSISWYIYSRGVLAIGNSTIKPYFTWSFWSLIGMFILGQILERGNPGTISTAISRIGSISLAFFLHLLLFVILVDIIRVLHHLFNIIPTSLATGIFSGKMLFIYGISIASLITFGGFINAKNPLIKKIDLTINKHNSQRNSLKVVLATDVHLGVMLGSNHAQRLVKQINEQKPDIVLFGGDLVDHNPTPVIKNDLGVYFEKIKAPLGIFAVTGNHEYMGKPNVTIEYFAKHGVTFIQDSILTIDGVIQIIGRNDKDKNQITGKARKEVSEIMNQNTQNLPKILIDHQPLEYNIVQKHNIDLMLSGHTHKGQLWPLSLITNLVYENHFGLLKKGKTLFYTSSGYGTWGPPIRTGNRPELVVFNISLQP